MRAPLSWLRDFAPIDGDVEGLVAFLDDLGLMVEGVERVGEGLGDIVVARVLEVGSIEGADRIRRVVVEAGGEPLEIVCGAFNFGEGDLVPLARVGTVLPDGTEIGRRKMRGVTSNGMLCSGRELALSDDGAGLLVLTGVEGVEAGTPIIDALGIEPDVVFDITVEGNRPDAWCMVGIARDLAARLGVPFAIPEPRVAPTGAPVDGLASAAVEAPDMCPRLTVRVLESVAVGPSPALIARRLTMAGMRPINNVVDASNYVMLELGQPTHPYDLDRLGAPGLLVRRARPGEVLTTLDGVDRTLGVPGPGLGERGEDCVICDAAGEPVGLGGIFGGTSSEISGATTRVLLEAAYFDPMAIARTSKSQKLRTEASARFERGCDPLGIDRATDRFCELLVQSAPGTVVATGTLDVRGALGERTTIRLRTDAVNGLLGTALGTGDIAGLLVPIGFECTPEGDDALSVLVPSNRPDVRPAPHGVADLAEEVARTHGYATIARDPAHLARARRADRDPAGPPAGEGGAGRPGGHRGVDPVARRRGRRPRGWGSARRRSRSPTPWPRTRRGSAGPRWPACSGRSHGTSTAGRARSGSSRWASSSPSRRRAGGRGARRVRWGRGGVPPDRARARLGALRGRR